MPLRESPGSLQGPKDSSGNTTPDYHPGIGNAKTKSVTDSTQTKEATIDGNTSEDTNTSTEDITSELVKENPFRYAGYYWDRKTQYYYLQSRYYNPRPARFISEDSYEGEINTPITLNQYTYASNNPVMHEDPNGHWVVDAFWTVVDGIAYIKHPSLSNAKWLVLDLAGFADPTGTASSIAHAGKIAKGVKIVNRIKKLPKSAKKAHIHTINLDINKGINFTKTTSKHMHEKSRYVPVSLLREVILFTIGFPDPRGSRAMMHYRTIYRNGSKYNLEVLYRRDTNMIYHFEYSRKAMGPLPKIK